jgi:hypothetical protein
MDSGTVGQLIMIWQSFILVALITFVIAWVMILTSKSIEPSQKLVWLLGTLFLPVIGPIIFFSKYSGLKKVGA